MRVLMLHCNSAEYAPVKKEIEAADDLPNTDAVHIDEVVAAFIAVEEGDNANTAAKAADEITSAANTLACAKVLIYPYAHLSSDLASHSSAAAVLDGIAGRIPDRIERHKAPFGWTKSFRVDVKGHPLAESFRIISGDSTDSEALKKESKIQSDWRIMTPDGKLHKIDEFDFGGHENLETLAKYEKAKRREAGEAPPHVSIMKRMAIADYEPASDPGNMRFYPNGRLIKSLIERYVTGRVREYGGYEVETPIMYDSHHPSMESYFNRFPARQYNVSSDDKRLFLRFAACFGQFLMANDMQMSYRHLPYRLYELTRYSFRREQSGELVGLRRLRAFTMPDCHAFCKDMEQAVSEIQKRFDLSKSVMADLGIAEYEMAIRFTEEFYRENPGTVQQLARRHGRPVLVEIWRERFFYFVLKWEFNYVDSSGKASALSTDQIDVENGARYGIEFVDERNTRRHPLILHNSPSGAVERVIYALLEGAAARAKKGTKPELPLWLAPTQVRIIPLKEEYRGFSQGLADRIASHKIRADVDDRNESVGRRIRDAEKEWIKYILVIGDKEANSEMLNVRERSGHISEVAFDEFVDNIKRQTKSMPYSELNAPSSLSSRPQIMV